MIRATLATSAAYLLLMPPLLLEASAYLLRFGSCLCLPGLRDTSNFRGDVLWHSEDSQEPAGLGIFVC